jgi:hypothetical protein
MTQRLFCLTALVLLVGGGPVWAQPDEIARLRAELVSQQKVISQLLSRLDALEKNVSQAVTKEDLEEEAKTQQESVNSLRETLLGKVNVSGYSNFRYFNDDSHTPSAFQLNNLGLILGKQLGRFSFLTELELQNVPHHGETAEAEGEEGHSEAATGDISGEGQVAVENAWMEYNHNRHLNVRAGKQLSPQYWWQNRYPNLTYSTDLPIHLRELFPPELVGVMVRGTVAKPVGASEFGVGYSLYASNNEVEGNSQADLRDGKAWGGRVQLRFPTGGVVKRFDVAGDIYRGRTGHGLVAEEHEDEDEEGEDEEGDDEDHEGEEHEGPELAEDNVVGFEAQLEVSRFLFNGEWARGESQGLIRTGYYVQPAVRLSPDWLTFYRLEQVKSPRILRAERRHLAGVNYRPFSQVALKFEYYRSVPLSVSFIESEHERKPFNGFATAAVFFF